MSNLFFPDNLSGMAWDCTKRPEFKSVTQSPATGKDTHLSQRLQAVYEFKLRNNWLNAVDKAVLDAFFLARHGSFDDFLYVDEDSVIRNQPFALGDGSTTEFQLKKITHDAVEITQNIAVNPSLFVNGVLKTAGLDYLIHKNGLVVMTTPPELGAVLSWTGTAYYRCFFAKNTLEYNQFAYLLHNCDEINFKGSMAWGYLGNTVLLTSMPYPLELRDTIGLQAGVISLDLREIYKVTELLNEIVITPALVSLELSIPLQTIVMPNELIAITPAVISFSLYAPLQTIGNQLAESVKLTPSATKVYLGVPLQSYINGLPELLTLTPAFTALDLKVGLKVYNNALAESLTLTPAFAALDLKVGLKVYSNALAESLTLTPAVIGLTLI